MAKRIVDMTPAQLDRKRKRDREWFTANAEKVRARSRAWKVANAEKQREYRRAFKAANPEKVRAWDRAQHLRKYGLTTAQVERMCAEQGGACAICKGPFSAQKRRPSVDHCHASGRVRSLLCHNCNVALGHARESPDLLRQLADYLERFKS